MGRVDSFSCIERLFVGDNQKGWMKKVLYLANAIHRTQRQVWEKDGRINQETNEDEHSSAKKRKREESNSEGEEMERYRAEHLPSWTEYHWKGLVESKKKMKILEDAMEKNWAFDPDRKEVPSSAKRKKSTLHTQHLAIIKRPNLPTFTEIRKKSNHPNFVSKKVLSENIDKLKAEILS